MRRASMSVTTAICASSGVLGSVRDRSRRNAERDKLPSMFVAAGGHVGTCPAGSVVAIITDPFSRAGGNRQVRCRRLLETTRSAFLVSRLREPLRMALVQEAALGDARRCERLSWRHASLSQAALYALPAALSRGARDAPDDYRPCIQPDVQEASRASPSSASRRAPRNRSTAIARVGS